MWDFKFSRRRVWCSELSSGTLIPDDGGSTHLWNVGRQSFYTAVHPRRQFWTTNPVAVSRTSTQAILNPAIENDLQQVQSISYHHNVSLLRPILISPFYLLFGPLSDDFQEVSSQKFYMHSLRLRPNQIPCQSQPMWLHYHACYITFTNQAVPHYYIPAPSELIITFSGAFLFSSSHGKFSSLKPRHHV
jgi:hypothetical protein